MQVKESSSFELSTMWHGRSKKTLKSKVQALKVWPILVVHLSFQYRTALAKEQDIQT